jgi:hypothetical protein
MSWAGRIAATLLALLIAAAATTAAAEAPPGAGEENEPGGFLAAPAQAQAPASAPTSQPGTGAGEIADPSDEDEDEDDWPDDKPATAAASSVSPTLASKAATPRADAGPKLLTWWARGTLRLGLDTHHSGPHSSAQPGVREDVMDLVSDAAVGLKLRLRESLRMQVSGRLRLHISARRPTEPGETYTLFNGDLHRTDFEALPGDTFVELSTKRLDLQLGLVSTVWGAADIVNPNDRLTASDMRLGPLSAERLPVLAAKAELYLGPLTLTGIWQPVFSPHRIDLFGSDFALLGPGAPSSLRLVGDLADLLANDSVEGQWQGALVRTSSPRPFVDSSVGVRVSGTLRGWDLALQYTYGYERLPVVRLHGDLVQHLLPYLLQPPSLSTEQVLRGLARSFSEAPTVESVHLRQHQLGLSASGVLWRLVLDADVALLSRRSEHLADDGPGLPGLPLQQNGSDWTTSIDTPVLAYTLGARYTRGEALLVKLEWWHELLLDPLAQSPADRRELLLGGPQRGGAALIARYTIPRIDVTAQLLLHSELFHGSIIAAPELAYRFGDHLTAFVGAAIYAGDCGPGALFNQNDEVHLGLRGYL